MMATREELVELVIGVTKVREAIFPQSHVLKIREGVLKRLHPVRAAERYN